MPSPSHTIRLRALFALSAVFAVIPAHAGAQVWSGGLLGGVGQGSYTGEHEFGWRVTGPNTVLFVNRTFGDRLSLQPEAGMTRKVGVSTTGGSTLTFSASHLDLLLLAQYNLKARFGTRPFLIAGPSVVYRFTCNLEFMTGGLVSNTTCNNSGGFSRTDFGVAFGGGLNWKVSATTLTVEARGSTSFRTTIVPLESSASRSLSWSVLAGASMPIRFTRRPQPLGGPMLPALEPIRFGAITGSNLPAELAPSIGAGASTKRVSLTAVDADVRSLLIAIAREAGISLVVSNDVRRRISVSFRDASPEAAIRAIIAETGLTVVDPPASRALPAVVYYQLPVSVDEAPAEAIALRFGVSAELAKWLVESRPAPAPRQDRQP